MKTESDTIVMPDGTFHTLTADEMNRIDAWTEKLKAGYVPSEEELRPLDAMPELALQARVIINGTLKGMWEKDPADSRNIRLFTDSLYELGDYLIHFEYWDEALAMLDQCIEIVRPETEKGYDEHLLTTLYVCHDRMGDIAVTAEDYGEASRHYLIVRDIISEIAEHDPRMETDSDYVVILDKLGYTAELSNNYSEAEKWYRESVSLKLVRTGTEGSEGLFRVGEARKNLGSVLLKAGRDGEAKKELSAALTACDTAWENWKDSDVKEVTVSILDKLGIIAKDESRWNDAEGLYRRCMDELEALIRSSREEREDWKRSLSRSAEKLADAYQLAGDFKNAEPYLRKSISISEKLLRKYKADEDIRDLSASHDKLGDVYGVTSRPQDAVKEYEKALRMHKRLKGPRDPERQAAYFFTLKKMSIIAKSENDYVNAVKWGEEALKAAKTLCRMDRNAENRRFLANCYTDLGELEEDQECWSQAKDWYTKALRENRALYREDPNVENKSEYSDTHDGLGYVAVAVNDLPEAKKHFTECLTLNEELLADTGATDEKRALAVTCRQLGLIALSDNDIKEARRYLNRSLILQKDVMHESEDDEDRLTYEDTYKDVVTIPPMRISLPSNQG